MWLLMNTVYLLLTRYCSASGCATLRGFQWHKWAGKSSAKMSVGNGPNVCFLQYLVERLTEWAFLGNTVICICWQSINSLRCLVHHRWQSEVFIYDDISTTGFRRFPPFESLNNEQQCIKRMILVIPQCMYRNDAHPSTACEEARAFVHRNQGLGFEKVGRQIFSFPCGLFSSLWRSIALQPFTLITSLFHCKLLHLIGHMSHHSSEVTKCVRNVIKTNHRSIGGRPRRLLPPHTVRTMIVWPTSIKPVSIKPKSITILCVQSIRKYKTLKKSFKSCICKSSGTPQKLLLIVLLSSLTLQLLGRAASILNLWTFSLKLVSARKNSMNFANQAWPDVRQEISRIMLEGV